MRVVTQNFPRQFTWNYAPDPPGQQGRTWTQVGPSNWVELNQSGAYGFFSVIQPSANIDGNTGVVVENDAHSIDAFIPAPGANGNNPDWLRVMAPGGTQWGLLGQLTSASVPPRQFTWNYAPDPPGQQVRTWTQVGPSNWLELNQNGAHGFFSVIQPSTNVDGNTGVVVENDAHSIDVFIPALDANGSNPDWLRVMAPGGTQWSLLGQFTSAPAQSSNTVTTTTIQPQPPPPPSAPAAPSRPAPPAAPPIRNCSIPPHLMACGLLLAPQNYPGASSSCTVQGWHGVCEYETCTSTLFTFPKVYCAPGP